VAVAERRSYDTAMMNFMLQFGRFTLSLGLLLFYCADITQIVATEPAGGPQWIWAEGKRYAGQHVALLKSFVVEKPIRSATVRAFADFNHMVIALNGKREVVIEDYSHPVEEDVVELLQPGENKLEISATSSAGPSAVALSLEITFDDGTTQTIVTDSTWQTLNGNAVATYGALSAEAWARGITNTATNELDDYTQWKQALTSTAGTDPAAFLVPPGFEIELLRSATPEEGSWISLTFDPKGRLIVAKESQGLLRITIGKHRGDEVKVEVINDTLKECRGLLSAFDALYVNANVSKGFYRLRDTDGDDRYDEETKLYESETMHGGGHGWNDLALGPDNMIYNIRGDSVALPDGFDDLTSPFREARRGTNTREGHVFRVDRDGKQGQLVATGLRNPYGIDFNSDGEMFTYDADAEFDMGSPWYRPTRVDHLVSGADFGWRGVTGTWPPYYPDHPDNAQPSVDIGRGSPTGVKFGTKSNFPSEFRRALFILDWSYGRIIAVHMTPRGASYACRAEEFLKGRPLNVTDLEFGPDGAMYFVTGGRKTQSGLYRVRYVGPTVAEQPPSPQQVARTEHATKARALRRKLEAFHGRVDSKAVDEAWPYLDSADPTIRYAARIAIEHQPVAGWQERALQEFRATAAITALTALARSGETLLTARLDELIDLNPEPWPLHRQLNLLQIYSFCLPSLTHSVSSAEAAKRIEAQLKSTESVAIQREAIRLLVNLEVPWAIGKALDLLAGAATTSDQLHYLFLLSQAKQSWTADERRAFVQAYRQTERFQGGEGMPKFIRQIKHDWLSHVPETERSQWEAELTTKQRDNGPPPPAITRPLVKEWKAEDVAPALAEVGQGRQFERGKAMFGMLCSRCHRMGQQGAAIGPDLTTASRRFSRRDMLESIVSPSKVIADQYRDTQIVTTDGRVIIGRIVPHTDFRAPVLRVATNLFDLDQVVEIPKIDIELHNLSPLSPMPQGLLNTLQRDEILDLLAYLETAGDAKARNFQSK
jgi:putative heme-binding domain-containing protein